MTAEFDVAVIGGGIAGVSAAYHLAPRCSVAVLEAEASLAYHSTGRSAALFFENYGAMPIRPLTRASRWFFESPPPELDSPPLTRPRGALWIATPEQLPQLEQIGREGRATGSTIERIELATVGELAPMVNVDRLGGALWETDPFDLDVAAVHQAFVRGLRSLGGVIRTGAPVTALRRTSGHWMIETEADTLTARTVVNASGAWGDVVAGFAGLPPVGLIPLKRTAFMVAGSDTWQNAPMVIDVGNQFYFKPDGVQILCSPADETPTEPGDARPESLDVAGAIDRINEATTMNIRSVRSEWAGLRTFTPDRAMVIGPDPSDPSFVWLVGQGGTGIQTAPAAGALVASLVHHVSLPAELEEAGVNIASLLPDRLRPQSDHN